MGFYPEGGMATSGFTVVKGLGGCEASQVKKFTQAEQRG